MIRNRKILRAIALFLLVEFVTQALLPTVTYALTSGPSQPEFTSFEPVSSTNMVDEFTGDFTYNLPVLEVPGPHGSGYPVSLSYHSGVTPEEEASWVGYGWTLNPGAINRSTRGVPDDFNAKDIRFHNKMPQNWTATVGAGVAFGEAFGTDLKLGFNAALRYNNYRGFGYNAGVGLSIGKGVVSLGYGVSDGDGSFSLNVSPGAALRGYLSEHPKFLSNLETYKAKGSMKGHKTWSAKYLKGVAGDPSANILGSKYGIFSFNDFAKPVVVHSYSGASYNIAFNFQYPFGPVPVGGITNLTGSYSYQKNTDVETAPAYGYLYSSNASNTGVMDYHVEKETDFNKRDVFLGIPFNDADNFMVTGEGIGGGFRLYNKTSGHFGPRKTESSINIYNFAPEVSIGWTFGPGVDIGVGDQKMVMDDWKRNLSSFESATSTTIDEPVFFRFSNDLGGEWGSSQTDKPIQASISNKMPSLPATAYAYNNGERSGRSSYIAYNANKDMLSGSVPSFNSFNKNTRINTQANRSSSDAETNELIGEIAVFNEGGFRYLYALPVYNKNEKNLSYSATKVSAGNIENNYFAYPTAQNISDGNVKVGQEQDNRYASTFLLTEISLPDYVDMKNDGPTEDDLGGYTRFNYEKLTSSDWYSWRAPYRGLIYNKSSHSDPKDDMVTYSEGEKELYFLHAVETKTHVALFVTSAREDSKEAPVGDNALSKTAGTPGSVAPKKLDRIDLYSLANCQKDANGLVVRDANGSPIPVSGAKPIKSVVFKYNYTLCTGLPNSTSGKLTLERVHFEYNGLATTRISPYVFSYNYPNYASYPSKYKSGTEDVTAKYSTLVPANGVDPQNPVYSPFLSDAWGNYQVNGQDRFNNMRTWIDQNVQPNQVGFDPAAWHLKVIKVPSGGEIHIQYEADDYAFVQDNEAHVMASLLGDPGLSNRFYIDFASIGITSTTDKQDVADLIKRRYVDNKHKIYFKFLYRLIGNVSPDLEMCNAEFITGYASVSNCVWESATDKVYIDLANTGKNKLPYEVCTEFVKTQRLGMLDPNGNCIPGMNEGTSGNLKEKAAAIVRQLYGMAKGIATGPITLCQKLSPANSYLRIPTPIAKKGGGIRVKRLLMFDTGMEGESVLYGNEYLYQTTNEKGRIISSGVATNEPQTIREENILVDFIARKGQNLWDKVVAGKDKKQSEGPLGESVLPGASVGYSKVTIRSIHTGKTNPGFSISEFYTAKDFPISLAHPDKPGTMTGINSPNPEKKMIFGVLVNIIKDKSWATQGFSFILNNMHGQIRSKAAYNGPSSDVIALSKSTLVSKTSYEFYNPGEKIPVMGELFGDVKLKNPGREVDLTFAQKGVAEKSYDANIEGDLEIAIIPAFIIPIILIYPTAIPSVNLTEGSLYTHATSKVVRYPAIVKKTTIYQDGILHTEENVAFDEWTGKPVAVKSNDEFKGAYLTQNVPASWEYQNYTAKYVTEGRTMLSSSTSGQSLAFSYASVSPMESTLTFSGDVGCSKLAQLTTGDVLELGTNYLFQVKDIDYSRDRANLVRVTGGNAGNPAGVTQVKIVRSGRNNKLSEAAGDVTFHNVVADNISASTIRQPEGQRYITSGTDANDGSLFIKDLNDAFANPALLPLDGPYYHMNMTQYVERLPDGCSADLGDATVKNVNIGFKTTSGNLTVEIRSYELLCGSEWKLVKMPD
jgi:hypothetical protein